MRPGPPSDGLLIVRIVLACLNLRPKGCGDEDARLSVPALP
jgi:hypothetical protein